MRSATLTIRRPNETSLLPVWQSPDGGDFGAGAGTTATWTAPKEGPHNLVLVVSDGERRFGRQTLIDVKKGPQTSPTPLITFAPTPTPTPAPGAPSATPTPPPKPTLPVQMGVRADGDDSGKDATNDEKTAPGSTITYFVIIDNDSNLKVTVASLVDSVYGNIADCKTAGGAASVIGIVLDEDDHDGSEVDPNGPDAVLCTYERPAPATPGTEVKNVVTVTVQSPDGQTGVDVDDNTKVTTTS